MAIIERYRCPLKWELVRQVIPALLMAVILGMAMGYAWARAAYQFIR